MKARGRDRVKCRTCLEEKPKVRADKFPSGDYRYVGDGGRSWNGTQCPDCFGAECRLRRRVKKGTGDRRSVLDPSWIKGVWAEDKAAAFFAEMGFQVIQCEHNGPDLIIKKEEVSKTVEVKFVGDGGRNRLRVSAVRPNRKNDDLVAYVYSDGEVFVRSMREHLESCNKSGMCNVVKFKSTYVAKTRSRHHEK